MTPRSPRSKRIAALAGALLLYVFARAEPSATAQDEPRDQANGNLPPQTILPPGLYLFQTRTRDGSCNDATRTGYVTSAVATIDGVPGARTMTLKLLNSKWWPSWTLSVAADNSIVGDAFMNGAKDDSAGSSHFELHEKKGRYQGVGTRTYNSVDNGKPVRCSLNYDALLKPLG